MKFGSSLALPSVTMATLILFCAVMTLVPPAGASVLVAGAQALAMPAANRGYGKIRGPALARNGAMSSAALGANSLSTRDDYSHNHSSSHDIYVAGFFALSSNEIEAALGLGVMPAIQLALDHVAKKSFLDGHRLHLVHNDTEVGHFNLLFLT